MRKLYLLIFTIILSLNLYAQEQIQEKKQVIKNTVTGFVYDTIDTIGLPGAHVFYGKPLILVAVTDVNGQYKFEVSDSTLNDLMISFAGYTHQKIKGGKAIKAKTIVMDTIFLQGMVLNELVVTGTPPLATQKGDTTVFNAGAVKMSVNADLEALLKKLPGFEIIDGKIMAQGKQVEKIYVDGTEYFLNDPQGALKNLPANLISKVKLFDDESDEAKFSGYSDGEKQRALDVVTKNPNQMKYFGNANLGYGVSEKLSETIDNNDYRFEGRANIFDRKKRVSIDANLRNNNVASQLKDAKLNDGGGVNQQYGIGANFSLNKKQAYSITANYRNNSGKTYSGSLSEQDYFKTEAYDSRIYENENHQWGDNQSHSVNTRFEFTLGEKDRISFTPSGSVSNSEGRGISFSQNVEDRDTINRSLSNTWSNSSNNNINGAFTWMHRFKKPGQMLTLSGNYGYSKGESENERSSKERNLNNDNLIVDTIRNIQSVNNNESTQWRASLSLSQPLTEKSRLSLRMSHSQNSSTSIKTSYNYADSLFQDIIGVDSALTSTMYDDRRIEQIGLNYNYNHKKWQLLLGAAVSQTNMKTEYLFLGQTQDSIVKSKYVDFSPHGMLNLDLSDEKSLSLNYNGRTSSPQTKDLQDVLNVDNPLQVSKGNPNLEKSYSHSLSSYYNKSNNRKSTYLSINIAASQTFNQIARNVQFLDKDTLINGYLVQRGARLSTPVNLNGNWRGSFSGSYSFPIKKLKLRMNNMVNYDYSKTPSIYDNLVTSTSSHQIGYAFTFSTNFSEKLDIFLNSNSSYRVSSNSSTGGANYYNQSVSLDWRWTVWKELFFRGNFMFDYYLNQKDDAINQSNNILDLHLGYMLGKYKQFEITFSANDVFREKDKVSYQLTDLYSSKSTSTRVQTFYMISLNYRFNSMRGKKSSQDVPNQTYAMPFFD